MSVILSCLIPVSACFFQSLLYISVAFKKLHFFHCFSRSLKFQVISQMSLSGVRIEEIFVEDERSRPLPLVGVVVMFSVSLTVTIFCVYGIYEFCGIMRKKNITRARTPLRKVPRKLFYKGFLKVLFYCVVKELLYMFIFTYLVSSTSTSD